MGSTLDTEGKLNNFLDAGENRNAHGLAVMIQLTATWAAMTLPWSAPSGTNANEFGTLTIDMITPFGAINHYRAISMQLL